jgi:guanosine-3',5'-bis(diphosphate) 3'-pyrophosphohydrolase
MSKTLSTEFENAVHMLTEHIPQTDEHSRKPILFHDIRVGVYLYENGYERDIVLAGLLHDVIEWSSITEKMIKDEFGDKVLGLVLANTKDDSIEDKHEKTAELIQRCVKNSQDALIVKTADILDSFKWYSNQDNTGQLKYCMRNAEAILKYKPDDFDDEIFKELTTWRDKFASLSE